MLYNLNIFTILNFLFILCIFFLVCTDTRFVLLNRKFFFFFIYFSLIFISIYLDKIPYLVIKDLFWYSVLIHSSFIFHILLLSRIFIWCVDNHYEYLGFIVSRISFFFSLWNLKYILRSCIVYICDIHSIYIDNKFKKNLVIIFKKYKIIYILQIILTILESILLYFSIVFTEYSLFLLGNNNKQDINLQIICKFIMYFLIFFSISYLLNIPRLYCIWIFLFLYTVNYNYIRPLICDLLKKKHIF
jgi:hypothetical protein